MKRVVVEEDKRYIVVEEENTHNMVVNIQEEDKDNIGKYQLVERM